MKSFPFLLLTVLSICTSLIAGENLLKNQWWQHAKNTPEATSSYKDGVFKFTNRGRKKLGFSQSIKFQDAMPAAIKVSGEVRGKNIKTSGRYNFSLYMDIVFSDGSQAYGQTVTGFQGTYDWKKISREFTYKKPIKKISFNVLFRSSLGEAEFRNLVLEVIK